LYVLSLFVCAGTGVGCAVGKVAPGAFVVCVAWQLGLTLLGNFVFWTGIFGKVLLSGPQDKPVVALTFDDGPDEVTTPRVLEVLEKHGAKATFFVMGQKAEQCPQLVARLTACGHQIENHSHRHSWGTAFFRASTLVRELSQATRAIVSAGAKTPHYFRPPAGILSPPIAAAARTHGLTLCGWSKKARDGWKGVTVEQAVGRLSSALRPGAILLLHDAWERPDERRTPIAPLVLERLLPMLAERGLSAVTLHELLDRGPGPEHDGF